MSKILSLNDLGSFGVNTDIEQSELDKQIFTSGQNFLLSDGKIQTFNGSTKTSAAGPFTFPGMISYHNNVGFSYYLVLTATNILKYDGATWSDITRTGGVPLLAGDEFLWTICELGTQDIMNNSHGYPIYYNVRLIPDACLDLPWDATNTWRTKAKQCKVMRSHKNFLFALGMTEGAIEYPNSYRWSNPAVNNGVPNSWDEAVIGTQAGKAEILGGGGNIIDGHSLRDAFCIYSSSHVDVLDYIGGTYVWRSRQLSTIAGILTSNCLADIFTAHIFLTDGDILYNDGNSIKSILNKRMRTMLNGAIDTTYYDRSFAVTDRKNKEVWICIPENGASLPTLAFVYNWINDTVSLRDLDGLWSSLTFGPISISTSTWASSDEPWNTDAVRWSFDASSPFSDSVIAINYTDNSLYTLAANDGSLAYNTTLERLSFSIESEEAVVSIKSAYPKFRSMGDVSIQIGAQDYHGAPTRWQPPIIFNPANMRKVDIRSTGKLHCWRIQSVDAIPFIFTGIDFEYEINGMR